MSPVCAVPFCPKRNPTHLFPSQPKMRKLWVMAIKRGHQNYSKLFYPSKYSRICNSHFKESDFVTQSLESVAAGISYKRLKKGAVPSVFPVKLQKLDDNSSHEVPNNMPDGEIKAENVFSEDDELEGNGEDPKAGRNRKDFTFQMNLKRKASHSQEKSPQNVSPCEEISAQEEKGMSREIEDLKRKDIFLGVSLELAEEKNYSRGGNTGQSLDAEDNKIHIINEALTWEEELSQNTSRYPDFRKPENSRHSQSETVKLQDKKNRLINFKKLTDFIERLACPECFATNAMNFKSENKCLVSSAVLWKFQCKFCGYNTVLRDSKIIETRSSNFCPYSRNALLTASTIVSYSGYCFMKQVMDRLDVPFGEDEAGLLEALHRVQLMEKKQVKSSVTISVSRNEENCEKDPTDRCDTEAAQIITEHIPLSAVKDIQKNEQNKMIQNVFRRLLIEAASKNSNHLTIKKKRIAAIIDYVSKRFGVGISISSNTLPVHHVNILPEDELEIKDIVVTSL